MASVRGVAVLNAIRYVRESFGPNPHQAVVKALSEPHRATFLGPIREASWKPVEDLIAYLETAQRLLAPADPLFFRRVGRFSGQLERASQGFEVMVADPSTAMRMGPVVWRSFFDAGRLEVEILGPREGMARVFDFPASRALCDRRSGAWEGLLSTPGLRVEVTETRCCLSGSDFCENRVLWVG
ncbi:MAG TPA: hypothetical protein VJU18_09635 [Vicinamibacteria bacterium]|nr:hypothetical protein [Vicinamibacteria bacterium]